MPKHKGCYLCGSMEDEILTAHAFQAKDTPSVALCSKCEALPERELRTRLTRLEEMKSEIARKAREAIANG